MAYRADHCMPRPPEKRGVTVYRSGRCFDGYTLVYSRQSERGRLIDMQGNVVHVWTSSRGIYWHYAEMLPNGHLLVVANHRSGQEVLELDWQGRVVWRDPVPAHHDAERLPDGHTLVVCNARAHYPEIRDEPILYDYLLERTPDGKTAWEWHYAPHESQIAEQAQLPPQPKHTGDWPHINTVERLPETPLGRRDARFRAGNLLVSPRHCHMIFVIDRDSGDVVWTWGPGEILGQHEPTMLPDGNILLFDNGRGNDDAFRGWSRALEVAPESGQIVWQYRTDPPTDFWTPVGSGAQRLPNGNTLICAMNWDEPGRVFEVTTDGEIVWEYWNVEPLSTYRAYRYAPEVVEALG